MRSVLLILCWIFVPIMLWSQNTFDHLDNQKHHKICQESKIIHIILSINGEIISNFNLEYGEYGEIKPIFQVPGGFYMDSDDWKTFEKNHHNVQLCCKYKRHTIKIPIERIFMENIFFVVYISTNDIRGNKKLFKGIRKNRFAYSVKIFGGNIQSIREIYYSNEDR